MTEGELGNTYFEVLVILALGEEDNLSKEVIYYCFPLAALFGKLWLPWTAVMGGWRL